MSLDVTTDYPDVTDSLWEWGFNDTIPGLNETMSGVNGTALGSEGRRPGGMLMHIIKAVYVIGILGNAMAIVVIRRGERRVRNRKYVLLLTSLAANDLVALVGQLCLMVVSERVAGVAHTREYCGARVVLRVFGIGSVCIAVTMAMERYLALTRPFLYQKQVTYYVIRTTLAAWWLSAAVLTCVPLLGLGRYYDASARRCERYRNADTAPDLGYAILYVSFGTLLCVLLVYCNLAVIRALYAISSPRAPSTLRRLSRTSCRHQRTNNNTTSPQQNLATAEEVFFSRLMATLSVLFMICWMPQMLTSALYLSLGAREPRLGVLAAASDVLMLLNYVLDPLLYVLMSRSRLSQLCRSLACKSTKSSTHSVKTSCCPQETLLVSESLGAELRTLKPPAASV